MKKLLGMQVSKNSILSSLGAIVEYYDFVIFGYLTSVLNTLFFSDKQINNYFSFALGYLARPVGGIIFGAISDHFGRKISMMLSMIIIAIATFLMGCISPGEYAHYLIVVLRIIQGIAFASEMPNTMTLCMETDKNKFSQSFTVSASAIGSILSSMVCFGIYRIMSYDEILNFGWRIPFIFGGIISFIFCLIRKHISESPDFIQNFDVKTSNIMTKTAINSFKMIHKIAFCTIIMLLPAILIIMNLHVPSIAHEIYGMDRSIVHMNSSIGMGLMIIINPFLGHIFRHFKYAIFAIIPLSFILCLIMFNSMNMLMFFVFYQLIISASLIYFPQIIYNLFTIDFRVTGFSIAYNLSFIIASFSPIFVKMLLS